MTLLIGLSGAVPVWAKASACAELQQELKAMQRAQQQVLGSLVNNHESFASSLEEYAVVVRASRGASSASIVSSRMNDSASAFRSRGVQGKKMAAKLNKASQELLARVASCL